MGSQAHSSGEQSRTCWTPIMERYFIDLMLDHIHRGNRIGYTFRKQAWADMRTVFNAKFRSQCDKEVLKSHYTSLWKQFSDIKNLLDQSGFSWDDSRQMVVADDYVWTTYIKDYPDARNYKNKAVMHYSDLCLIYAHTAADGRYSRSSHDINCDDDIQGANTGGGNDGRTLSIGKYSSTYWTLPMDHQFIDLLLDQVVKGHRVGHLFLTQAWMEMVTLFSAKFGTQYDKEVLKNRYKQLKQQYNDVKVLLDENGFSWDETQEMVKAEDYVWKSYTKAYPDARSYKFKTVPSYHKLCVIYGEEESGGNSSPVDQKVDVISVNPFLAIEEEDIQCNTISGHSRTDWTPEMDRYLIDVMLNQLHKGHLTDQIFSKQTWIDIFASFSDRFGSGHDKFKLRDRFKNLRKVYDDMKNLLGRNGFSWDERLQTVTACDVVWDTYIKEYPDGKAFKAESKPNYNDLRLIYGNSTFEGRRNGSVQDMDFNDVGWDFEALRNGGSLTTGWTPPMDRYFIDLMLEQIRRGSMVDQKFNKRAWSDMIGKFNTKFGSQDKEAVLKNRFKKMRKRFNDMSTILGQGGFAWDEMQMMITANEELWDAYIQEHPDAYLYQNRTLPSYNDLFLIYGNANINGRRNCSTPCVDVDDDLLGVNVGKEDDLTSDGSDSPGNDWTKPMDQYFIDLMLEQVFEGNKTDHTFTKQAWIHIITPFNARFGLDWGNYVLENRYLSLMQQYNDITNLLKMNGFMWDETHKTVRASNRVWEAYIKKNPNGGMYRDKVFENYRDLSIIFGREIQDKSSNHLGPETDIGTNEMFQVSHHHGKKRRSETPLTSSGCSRKIKKTRKEVLEEEGTCNMLDNKIYSSIESIVDALQAIPDMDDEFFLDACDLLEDEKRAKAFVKMDITQRKKWLLRKIRS